MTLKTKTILRYILVLGFGLLLGWLFFASGEDEHTHDLQAVETAEGTVYTCSMHPQVRQKEPGDCPICGMDLIPLEEEGGDSNPYQLTMTANAVKLANVQTSTIGVVDANAGENPGKELMLSGKIELDENRVLAQTAHFPGEIEKLYINYEGEKVRAGQTIALVYSPQLLTAQQELLEAMKFEDSNPSLLASAKRKLKLWKLSDGQIQQVMDSGEPIVNWPIKADFSGVVTGINVESGEHVTEGAVLYQVADLNQLWAVFDAYEQNLPWIREGDNIRFNVSAYPEREFTGKVSFIDPFINPETRTAEVRTEVRNANGLLKPRMFARARISSVDPKVITADRGRELTVPKSAVMWTGKRSVVYVKVPGKNVPTYEMREVTLGSGLSESYLVEEGLQPGEEVVTHGTFTVDAAAQLNNKPSMMNRDIRVKQSREAEKNPEQLQLNVPDFVSATPEDFQSQLQNVVNYYLSLKDELVASRQGAAKEAAQGLLNSLEQVDMGLLPDTPHQYWMGRLTEMEEHAEAIASTQNIDEQRRFFKTLSEGLIRSAKAFGTAEKLYVQYCPMADDDQGANWLSQSEEIRNPYYGNMMLTCGEVEEIINP